MSIKITVTTQTTKSIRISAATYRDLEKIGTLSDSFDSVIRELLRSREKRGVFNQGCKSKLAVLQQKTSKLLLIPETTLKGFQRMEIPSNEI